jgi:CRP/FNR family transcriptional regulator, cyclic AMP receptor protein
MATMVSSAVGTAPQTTLEDPLAHLPCSTVVRYKKGQSIYHEGQSSTGLYLIIDGRVKVCRVAEDGHQVMLDIYKADDFFGESALLGLSNPAERATALENTEAMMWTTAELEAIAAKRPRLAVALWQILAQRSIEFARRIESFSRDNVSHRLARSLVRLAERLGTADETGALQMAALTHELLAQYVGTSREIVTHYMNQFRRQGYVGYSRKGISIYREAFQDWLRQDGRLAAGA